MAQGKVARWLLLALAQQQLKRAQLLGLAVAQQHNVYTAVTVMLSMMGSTKMPSNMIEAVAESHSTYPGLTSKDRNAGVDTQYKHGRVQHLGLSSIAHSPGSPA